MANTILVRVTSVSPIAQDIRLVTLSAVDGSQLPTYQPGSHIDLHMGPGLIRQYSLCGPHDDPASYSVAVKREPESRGGSKWVHEDLDVGTELEISLPRNNFPMAEHARHSILVAGGIGITPLISMARVLNAQGQSFELLYFCRSSDHVAFRDELESGALSTSSRMFLGLNREAVAEALRDALAVRSGETHLYLCGPRPFMDTVQEVAAQSGWPVDAVHLEYFGASEQAIAMVGNRSFQVTLAQSGVTVDVGADETIIDALRARGIEVETSCEQGVCGTCVTTVLEGVPDHRDCFLTSAEKAQGDCMAICISRSKSPGITLDI
ncbi:PDR/VanB family oxidoreductase [Caballeronia cordobensis]|uniref:PDR/VanB family oxidoreductase n=1 Tax=Caballeronia cordobensis TaxID=1353886 RepID=UPI0006AD7603|nr:PDR/VanB family oxidoreductase [Caballeronia cordobensis]